MTSADVGVIAGRVRRLTRAVAYGVVVALVVTSLAFLVRTKFEPLIAADDSAIGAATDLTRSTPWLRTFLLAWQTLSSPTVLYVVATAVCLWAWLRRGLTTRAWWAWVTMMVGWNLALDAKLLVQRARPVVDEPVSHAPGYSFPSGHAANAAIATTALLILVWPLLAGGRPRVAAVTIGAVFVLVTCLDRVFLGVHFPSDVVGGVLLGAGLVFASYAGYLGWRPPTPTPAAEMEAR